MAGSQFLLNIYLILLAHLGALFSLKLFNALSQQLGVSFLEVFDLLVDFALKAHV